MQKSIWNSNLPNFEEISTNISTDVLIVGGGLTGISLAYYLKDSNLSVTLIEQDKLASSTVKFSTAKLTYLQKDILSKIKNTRNLKYAKAYYQAQKDSINETINIINKEKINCHLEKSPSYLYVIDEKNINKLKKEYQLYKDLGAKITLEKELPLNVGEKLCCKVEDTYVFDPLEYITGLISSISTSKNVNIYENSRMINYQKKNNQYTVTLQNNHTIKCKYLIFTGLYPYFLFPYLFTSNTYIEKDIVTYDNHKHYNFNAINLDSNILSMRFHEDKIIKVIDSKRLSKKAITKEKDILRNNENYWINYDIITTDSLPVIGYIGSKNNGLYIASGYNTWGMTNSNMAARILKDMITNQKNKYAYFFRPYRNFTITSLINCIANLATYTYGFIDSHLPLFKKNKIVYIKGKRYGIVKTNNKKHIVEITCPHMKCGLVYNSNSKTWDCPCHGSRYDIDGNLLRGPATRCIKKR